MFHPVSNPTISYSRHPCIARRNQGCSSRTSLSRPNISRSCSSCPVSRSQDSHSRANLRRASSSQGTPDSISDSQDSLSYSSASATTSRA